MLALSFQHVFYKNRRLIRYIHKSTRFSFHLCTFSFVHTRLKSVLKDLKEDINKPYNDLHPVLRVLSWLLMR